MDRKLAYGAIPQKPQKKDTDDNQLLAMTATLQESEKQYHQLLDLIPDSVVILQDGNCRFAEFN